MTRRPRGPGLVYLVLSVVMLVLLGVVAFTATQPPPPTIAEFAPNAVQNIKNAPDEQRSSQGGAGGCATGQPPCTTPTPSPPPKGAEAAAQQAIDVPRVRHCVGDPPRQIEDPQSPPCVPYWQGDNGGATYKGVTRDEIRIAMPSMCPSVERCKPNEIADAVRFFNKRFEFYGRKIVLVDTSSDATCDDDNTAGSDATAQEADEEYHVFGSIECGSGDPEYARELARRGLVFVAYESFFGVDTARHYDPYLWQYMMEPESIFAHMGEWGCKRVAGGVARFSTDPTLRGKKRALGVILTPFNHTVISPDELTSRLKSCGATPKVVIAQTDPDPTNSMLQMKEAGVTSIFCLCHILDEATIGRAATAQAYFPEWLISSYDLNYSNQRIKLGFPPEQRKSIFGIQVLPMQVATADWPATWACEEVDTQCDTTFPAVGPYHALLLLASGLQMAGPRLTPATFARGLRGTVFPNPDHPIVPGKVGFDKPIARADPRYTADANLPHGMTADGIEFWWNEAANGPNSDEGNGAMCYVARMRYRLGAYPPGNDAAFFTGRCDSGGV